MSDSIGQRVKEYYATLAENPRGGEPDEVVAAMIRGDDDAWALLLGLVQGAPDLDKLGRLGAAAMETFMSDENVERHFTALAREIAENARFRYALRYSWNLPDCLDPLLDAAPNDEPIFE